MRLLFVLNAAEGKSADLQRMISYDYLLVHSGDVQHGPASLHPSVPFRGTEWLVKRDLVTAGLNQMFSRELIQKTFDTSGILYRGNQLTTAFVALLKSSYADSLRNRAKWLIASFAALSDAELEEYMHSNIGKWGAEFEHLTASADLEL